MGKKMRLLYIVSAQNILSAYLEAARLNNNLLDETEVYDAA